MGLFQINFKKTHSHERLGVCVTMPELLKEGAKAKKLGLDFRSRKAALMAGSKTSKLHGRGMDFHEVRRYVFGDEKRNIDWRVSARTGKMHTKLFTEEKERPIFLAVDQRQHLFFGSKVCFKSVLAARIAARLAFATIYNDDKLGGCIFHNQQYLEQKPTAGIRGLSHFLGLLAKANEYMFHHFQEPTPPETQTGEAVLSRLTQVCHPGSLVFLISDFLNFDDHCRHALGRLRRHNDVIAIHLYDELEHNLPRSGTLGFRFLAQQVLVEASDISLKRAYARSYEEDFHRIKELFSSQNIVFCSMGTHMDIDQTLSQLFLGHLKKGSRAA